MNTYTGNIPEDGLDSYLVKLRENDKAKLRLFCFPYAGGSAIIYSGLEKNFPDDIDVFAIQPPGRGVRFNEPAITSLETLVSELLISISPYLDKPFLFLGYSNGSLMAFELARRLQLRGMPVPAHMILAARRAPHLPSITPQKHNMSYDDFINELRKFSYTPEKILNDPEIMSVFMPMLRADFALGELYQCQTSPVLNVSSSLFWGQKDEAATKEGMAAWQDLISGDCEMIEFEEGHFFIHEEPEHFAAELIRVIDSVCQRLSI